jgi:chromosome segregation ATPase
MFLTRSCNPPVTPAAFEYLSTVPSGSTGMGELAPDPAPTQPVPPGPPSATAPAATAPPTQKQYQHLLEEVEAVNEEVKKLRRKLFKTQDALKERDDKVRTLEDRGKAALQEREDKIRVLENHINELLDLQGKNDQTIKMLMENNATLIEEESKVRESLDRMKKVFARAQMQSKVDRDKIASLTEERDALLGESRDDQVAGEKERNLKTMVLQTETDLEIWKKKHAAAEKTINSMRDQMAAMNDPYEAAKQIEGLQTLLADAEKELDVWKEKHNAADLEIMNLKTQQASKGSNETSKQLKKQRGMIDRLERKISALKNDDRKREIELCDEEMARGNDVVHRGCCDEDLEDSMARKMLRKMDCSGTARVAE